MSEGNGVNTNWDSIADGSEPNPLTQVETIYFPAFNRAVKIVGIADVRVIEEVYQRIRMRQQAKAIPVEHFGATLMVDGREWVLSDGQIAACEWCAACVVEPKRDFAWWARLQTQTGGLVDALAIKIIDKCQNNPFAILNAKNFFGGTGK
jgi:hypothetical protein